MPTAVALSFPLGRYHATPWVRAVNEGETEWPPSPWRILRSLIATRHLRWPSLPDADLESILGALASVPPAYKTPRMSRGQTRHYMPDLVHRSGEPSTDLVLDPYIWMDPTAELIVRWEMELSQPQRAALAKLCELVPYLGRSESLVNARLLDHVDPPDDTWWQIDAEQTTRTQLLVPRPEISRQQLEVTTSDVRRLGQTRPPGTELRTYACAVEITQEVRRVSAPTIEAVRWRLETKAPFPADKGILATEFLRTVKLKQLERQRHTVPSTVRGKVDGEKVSDDHRHAHWIWIDAGSSVRDLVLWMPGGDLPPAVAAAMIAESGFPGFKRWNPDGFRPGRVHVIAMGDKGSVLPDLVGPADGWTTRTPYLPVRHRKRTQSTDEWVRTDVSKECEYRGLPAPVEVAIVSDADRGTRSAQYRRYRWSQSMAKRRHAVWLRLRFEGEQSGPIVLGGLSHFGFGLFMPEG